MGTMTVKFYFKGLAPGPSSHNRSVMSPPLRCRRSLLDGLCWSYILVFWALLFSLQWQSNHRHLYRPEMSSPLRCWRRSLLESGVALTQSSHFKTNTEPLLPPPSQCPLLQFPKWRRSLNWSERGEPILLWIQRGRKGGAFVKEDLWNWNCQTGSTL